MTYALKIHHVCVNRVAHAVGKSLYPCSKQECPRKHVLPDQVGLRTEDYKDFAAIPTHIIWRVPQDFVIAEARRFKGMPPTVTVAAPAVGISLSPTPPEDTPPEKYHQSQQQLTRLLMHR